MLQVGDKAPDFEGVDQDGARVSLAQYAGKKLVLYFYPRDNTPGCTAEACSLRDAYEQLLLHRYDVVGVSADSVASHRKFAGKYQLPFRLIADPEKRILLAYDAWGEKKLYGKPYMGVLRKTFLISGEGIVEQIIDKVDTARHADQILK